MIDIHGLIQGGSIGMPLIIIAFAVVYWVFWRDIPTDRHPHKKSKSSR